MRMLFCFCRFTAEEKEVKWAVYPFVLAPAGATAASPLLCWWCFKTIVQEVSQESPPFSGPGSAAAYSCHQNTKQQETARCFALDSPARGMFNGTMITLSWIKTLRQRNRLLPAEINHKKTLNLHVKPPLYKKTTSIKNKHKSGFRMTELYDVICSGWLLTVYLKCKVYK